MPEPTITRAIYDTPSNAPDSDGWNGGSMMVSARDVYDDHDRSRFVFEEAGSTAELAYRSESDRLILIHTEVPNPLAGRGIGGRLVRAAVQRAMTEGLTIVPWCPFARTWLGEHPDAVVGIDIDMAMPPTGQRDHG